MAGVALEGAEAGVGQAEEGVHLAGGVFVAAAGVVDEEVVGLADAAGGLHAEAADRRGQGEDPDGGADGHVVIGGKVEPDRLDGHGPAVHPVAAAPPEAERARGPLSGADLIDGCAGPVGLGEGLLSDVAHAGEADDQAAGVGTDVRVVGGVDAEGLLLQEDPGGIAGRGLAQAEEEIERGHEIQGEDVKLDADPEHQRHAEDAAEHDARFLFREEQAGGGQVAQAVDDQQRPAGEDEVLKQNFGEGKDLKIRQHGVHAQRAAAGVDQHGGCAGHGAEADEERPEDQKLPGGLKSGMGHGETSGKSYFINLESGLSEAAVRQEPNCKPTKCLQFGNEERPLLSRWSRLRDHLTSKGHF